MLNETFSVIFKHRVIDSEIEKEASILISRFLMETCSSSKTAKLLFVCTKLGNKDALLFSLVGSCSEGNTIAFTFCVCITKEEAEKGVAEEEK